MFVAALVAAALERSGMRALGACLLHHTACSKQGSTGGNPGRSSTSSASGRSTSNLVGPSRARGNSSSSQLGAMRHSHSTVTRGVPCISRRSTSTSNRGSHSSSSSMHSCRVRLKMWEM